MLHLCLIVSIFISSYAYVLQPVPRLDGRIVGGESADIIEAPYQASILYGWIGSAIFSQVCSGALIRDNAVLTAANCIRNTRAYQWRVRVGSTLSSFGGHVTSVFIAVSHGSYNNRFENDVAMIFLSEYVKLDGITINTIELPFQDDPVEDGSVGFVTGWGTDKEEGNLIHSLQKLTIPILKRETCADAYSGINPVTDRMICAGSMEGGQDFCNGDSGAPLIVDKRIVGIASWGFGCARPGYPGVYTRVSAFRNWINTIPSLI